MPIVTGAIVNMPMSTINSETGSKTSGVLLSTTAVTKGAAAAKPTKIVGIIPTHHAILRKTQRKSSSYVAFNTRPITTNAFIILTQVFLFTPPRPSPAPRRKKSSPRQIGRGRWYPQISALRLTNSRNGNNTFLIVHAQKATGKLPFISRFSVDGAVLFC